MESVTVLENQNGLLDHFMKENGLMMLPEVKENFITLMEIYTKEILSKTRHKDKGNILIKMELNISEGGKKINKMVKAQKFGPTEVNLKENSQEEKNKEKENYHFLMDLIMMVILMIMKLMVWVHINMVMEKFIQDNGKKVR